MISDALRWLDGLLREEITVFRQQQAAPIEEFQGIYISSNHVDRLVADQYPESELVSVPATTAAFQVNASTDKGLRRDIDPQVGMYADADTCRVPSLEKIGASGNWKNLVESFKLDTVDLIILLITLAIEVDSRYETIYAYLNNDISKKYPTRNLILRLLSRAGLSPLAARRSLGVGYPLIARRIVHLVNDEFGVSSLKQTSMPQSWLSNGLRLNPVVAHGLLGAHDSGAQLAFPCFEMSTDFVSVGVHSVCDRGSDVGITPHISESIKRFAQLEGVDRPLLVLEGCYGSAFAFAASSLARHLNVPLLSCALEYESLTSAILHQAVYGSVIYIDTTVYDSGLRGNVTAANDSSQGRSVSASDSHVDAKLLHLLRSVAGPVVITTEDSRRLRWLSDFRTSTLKFVAPPAAERQEIWRRSLNGSGERIGLNGISRLADRFVLTEGQIQHAVRRLKDDNLVFDKEIDESLAFESARNETRLALGSLARKVDTPYTYEDLILPHITKQQISEISSAINLKNTVYSEWNFGKRFHQGQGIKALFSGASGTGKTMAASVIAKEVGLDLYAVDLSGIVSKYIGETEKNLDRVFAAAENSNAVLFFDECDALLGKRSEVKDAHDRYANIEVAYLLQKMELHAGAVILATNFSKNMDQAFARRIQFVVEFPVPTAAYRERLWRGMFPKGAPLSEDVDFVFLSEQFAIAGGDIRNVTLDAAFLAANEGDQICMSHLIRSMARQLVKQGRAPSVNDFKHYFPLINTRASVVTD